MNQKDILFQLTTNLSFRDKSIVKPSKPKLLVKAPLVDSTELKKSEIKSNSENEEISEDEDITIMNGITQVSKKSKKKSPKKAKNLKQINEERVISFIS